MNDSNIMKFVTFENKVVEGEHVWPFIMYYVSVIAFICVKNVPHDIYIYLSYNVFMYVFGI